MKQKIEQLIFSGEISNFKIAFEIIKSQGFVTEFTPHLMGICQEIHYDKNMVDLKDDIISTIKNKERYFLSDHLKALTEKERSIVEYAKLRYRENNNQISSFDVENVLIYMSEDNPLRSEMIAKWAEYNMGNNHITIYFPRLNDDELLTFLRSKKENEYYRMEFDGTFLNKPNIEEFNLKTHTLILRNCHPDTIESLQDIKEVKRIEIDYTDDISKNLSYFPNVTELVLFNKGIGIIDNFNFTKPLNLKELSLIDLFVKDYKAILTNKVLPIPYGIKFANNLKKLTPKSLKLSAAFGKSILTEEEKLRYFTAIALEAESKKKYKIDISPFNYGLHEISALMNVNQNELRGQLQSRLDELSETKQPDAKSKIYIAGTTTRKKTEIKEKLQEIGLQVVNKIDDKITHVIIGKNPKNYQQIQQIKGVKILSEQRVNKFITDNNEGFLEEAAKIDNNEIVDNTLSLLLSPEPANIAVGLGILESGGVPKSLIETLVVVQKTCPDAKIRKSAKTLLLKQNVPEWHNIINDKQTFAKIYETKAQAINNKLVKVAQKTSPQSALKLSLALFKNTGRGLRYVFYNFKKNGPERDAAYKILISEGNHFDFHKALGFKNWKNRSPEDATHFNMSAVARFPVDVLNTFPDLKTANFHNCKFNKIPAQINKFKNLTSLDLSFNFLTSLPKEFEALQQLEHLDLTKNNFETFPEVLFKLQGLKRLEFSHNGKYDTELFEVTEEIRAKMPNCEIIG